MEYIEPKYQNFLEKAEKFRNAFAGISTAIIAPIPQDASKRQYFRLVDKNIILMDSPPDLYDSVIFARLSSHLISLGLRAPYVYYADHDQGLLLIEDFGDLSFTKALKTQSQDEEKIYEKAVDSLARIHRNPRNSFVGVKNYDLDTLLIEARYLIEWYIPYVADYTLTKDETQRFDLIWRDIFVTLPDYQPCLVLRDYHVDNLMIIDDIWNNCGLLDFQDALKGHPSYDLVSLIEDARRNVNPQLGDNLLELYKKSFPLVDFQEFMCWYDFYGAQRHAKVLGIFVRLAQRDGKEHYLKFCDHVADMLRKKLLLPQFAELKDFLNHVSKGIL